MARCAFIRHRVGAALIVGAALAGYASAVAAAPVSPGGLTAALARAAPGAVLTLAPGVYAGPVVLTRPVTLAGQPGVILDGRGAGRVITIAAPDVTVKNLEIRNSGDNLSRMDAAIFVTQNGDRAVIEDNVLRHNLIGIFLHGPNDALVRGNKIIGRRDLRMNERGNGIQLWNTPGSRIIGNQVRYGRDGIFTITSRRNLFTDNLFSDLRFAVHYMYTNASEISGNISRGNHAGYALMFSQHLTVRGNLSDGDRDHGFLLNYANSSQIIDNVVRGGAHKCVFIYNSNKNRFTGNRFEGCDIGVHFTAGSERNRITENAFINNRIQVKYVGTRWLEWSYDGRGNYWSDNPAFDLNGDGIADTPYRPNGLIDQVMWAHPLAKLLLNSPGVQVLRWAQYRFPGLHPGGVIDSAPLMRPETG